MYHREDGKIVKLRDDIMCSTRYAIMSLRFAECAPRDEDEHEYNEYNEVGSGGY